jgi:thiamine-monophosphate kinase
MSNAQRPGEDQLIARYFAPMAGEGGFGLRDDAALVAVRDGHDLVVTVDTIVAGVHFFADDPPSSIGRKALAVNLSDLAAKGATPVGFVLGLGLAEDWQANWLREFADSLHQAARSFGCPLLGGDTVRANGSFFASVTAFGEVPMGGMVHRFEAKPGDVVCVSGTIGDAALGLQLRKRVGARWAGELTLEKRVYLTDRFLHPQPRVALSELVRRHARAAMDISDGLAGDLAKMCRTSGLSAEIDVAKLPLSPAARCVIGLEPALLDTIVTGGDDYELLCAIPPERLHDFTSEAREAGVEVAAIGHFCDGELLPLFRDGARAKRYEAGSYSHF